MSKRIRRLDRIGKFIHTYESGNFYTRGINLGPYYYIEDFNPGPGGCIHRKPATMFGTFPNRFNTETREYVAVPINVVWLEPKVFEYLNYLDLTSVPSYSSFNMLLFIYEFDQLFDLVRSLIWNSLKQIWNFYGAYTWGWQPLYSDIQAVLGSLLDLQAAFSKDFAYENGWKHELPDSPKFLDTRIGNIRYTGQFKNVRIYVHQQGRAMLPMDIETDVLNLMNVLGFHPDLATLWNAVPFSFVLDYILPVSDFLSQFQGWIKALAFTGSVSAKCTYDFIYSGFQDGYPNYDFIKAEEAFGKMYIRKVGDYVLEQKPLDFSHLSLRMPSLKRMVNMLYLALSGVRVK